MCEKLPTNDEADCILLTLFDDVTWSGLPRTLSCPSETLSPPKLGSPSGPKPLASQSSVIIKLKLRMSLGARDVATIKDTATCVKILTLRMTRVPAMTRRLQKPLGSLLLKWVSPMKPWGSCRVRNPNPMPMMTALWPHHLWPPHLPHQHHQYWQQPLRSY